MIPFNKPCVTGSEAAYIQEVIGQNKMSGNGLFGKKCTNWLEERLDCQKALLTPSCTADRKSTRLNSSHVAISYAVFCLKKKNYQLMLVEVGSVQYLFKAYYRLY